MVEYIVIAEDDGCSKGCCRGFTEIAHFSSLEQCKTWLKEQENESKGNFTYEIRECGPEIYIDLKN